MGWRTDAPRTLSRWRLTDRQTETGANEKTPCSLVAILVWNIRVPSTAFVLTHAALENPKAPPRAPDEGGDVTSRGRWSGLACYEVIEAECDRVGREASAVATRRRYLGLLASGVVKVLPLPLNLPIVLFSAHARTHALSNTLEKEGRGVQRVKRWWFRSHCVWKEFTTR